MIAEKNYSMSENIFNIFLFHRQPHSCFGPVRNILAEEDLSAVGRSNLFCNVEAQDMWGVIGGGARVEATRNSFLRGCPGVRNYLYQDAESFDFV